MATGDAPPTEPRHGNSLLTKAQREYLVSNHETVTNSTTTRYRIRDRVREGLRDFRLLHDHLEDRDLFSIFSDGDAHEDEIQGDVSYAVAFMYAGLDGEPWFREPFRDGVRAGELKLGNVEHSLDVEPRLAVDYLSHVDRHDSVEHVEAGDWEHLSEKSLLAVLQLALAADAIDFDAIYSEIESSS